MSARKMHVVAAICLAMLALTVLVQALNPAWVGAAPGGQRAPQAPLLQPASNSQNAAPGTAVSITYEEAIDAGTVSDRTFAVNALQTGLLTRTYTVAGGKIELLPPQPFQAGELVHVTATTGTLYVSGQGPLLPTVWMFRVAAASGSGTFYNSRQELNAGRASSVALGDLDGDRDLDAFVTNDIGASAIFVNDGQGTFGASDQLAAIQNGSDVALGDLDGDGDLDALLCRSRPGLSHVLLNDGNGRFGLPHQELNGAACWGVALGDLDGDADLDLILAINSQTQGASETWLNDGSGTFSVGQTLGNHWRTSVALGDLDSDGDLDAFLANHENQPDEVYLNDGAGIFTSTGQALGAETSSDVALGDWDSDGDLDALVLDFRGTTQIWSNRGDGFFSRGQSWGTGADNSYYGLDVGDLDGDSDLDAFVADYAPPASAPNPNEIWLNNGQGIFTRSNQLLSSPYSLHSQDVALGDVDGDGDLDAFVANDLTEFGPAGVTYSEVWLNADYLTYYPVYFPYPRPPAPGE